VVTSPCLCRSVCRIIYWKNNQPISLKLGVIFGLTNQKNWLTFAGDPVLDTDSGTLLYFPHCCDTGDFRFLSISHIQGDHSPDSVKFPDYPPTFP